MISFRYKLDCKPCCLRLSIYSHKESPIRLLIKGVDPLTGNVFFKDEIYDYVNRGPLFIPMPLTPASMVFYIVCPGENTSCIELSEPPKLVSLKRSDLPARYNNPVYRNLFRFAKAVAIMSSYKKPWSKSRPNNLLYCKNDPEVAAKISTQIIEEDPQTGELSLSNTPARVFREGSIMLVELSQPAFRKMTVYMRYAILLHELGHYLLDTDSEEASDQFAREIYFAEGFPKADYIYIHTDVLEPVKNSDGSINENHSRALINRLELAWSGTESLNPRYY